MTMKSLLRLGFALIVVNGAWSSNVMAHQAAEEMAEAASRFLAALEPAQRQKAQYPIQDEERLNWHFVPKDRNGLVWKEMSPAQRQLATGMLGSALSHRGMLKATTIMSLEQVLHELENQAAHRDPELYYVTVFGTPGPDSTWGWRWEGHHLSLNFTIVEGHHISVTPSFLGANPAEVRQGPRKGLRTLGTEEDLGRALVKSLSAAQRKEAVISERAPRDVITGASRKAEPLPQEGLPAARMSDEQKQHLRRLIEEYIRRYRTDLADEDLRKIDAAGFDQLRFAWAGALEPGQGHYYRVQGPTFVLEYDNTQNDANHIHAVWRNFDGDFGIDLLREHYDRVPHQP